MRKPNCFTLEDWLEYKLVCKACDVSPSICCHDCTQIYHDAMVLKGHCDHPEIIFVPWDGSFVGKKPGQKRIVDE